MVVVGLGGVFVEVLRDSALGLAPVSVAEAGAMLGRLRGPGGAGRVPRQPAGGRARAGRHRGAGVGVPGGHAGEVAELDVNPLIASGDRIVAVDALIGRR